MFNVYAPEKYAYKGGEYCKHGIRSKKWKSRRNNRAAIKIAIKLFDFKD